VKVDPPIDVRLSEPAEAKSGAFVGVAVGEGPVLGEVDGLALGDDEGCDVGDALGVGDGVGVARGLPV